jgi:hypothetical protein
MYRISTAVVTNNSPKYPVQERAQYSVYPTPLSNSTLSTYIDEDIYITLMIR